MGIGLVSNAYDHYVQKASCLFIRRRAEVAFEFSLLWPEDHRKELWVCSSQRDQGQGNDITLRTQINNSIANRLAAMEHDVHMLKSKEESLNGKLNLVLDALYEKGELKFLG